jgi:hypothetical protein
VITGISPPIGSSQGGTAITVTGMGFAGSLTATLDGTALRSVVAADDGTGFTAVVPSHAPGDVPLTVTTAIGSTSEVFTYTDGITVQPGTAPGTAAARAIDLTGIGFSALTFAAGTPDDTNAHVYLVAGAYDPTDQGDGTKTDGEIDECTGVLVVGDTELICTLDLTHSYAGGLLATVADRTVTDAATTVGDTTLSSATADFTDADVNLAVSGPGIPPGTVIATVVDSATASLSVAPVSTGSDLTVDLGPRAVTDATLTAGSTTVTSAATGFTADDTGRVVTGDGLPPNTVIASVTDGGTVELSRPATADDTVTMTVAAPVTVPDSPYTMTVVSDGSVDAQAGGGYTQSVISSGSTFTVAPF